MRIMRGAMLFECAGVNESLWADITRIASIIVMSLQVQLQRAIGDEALGAHLALVVANVQMPLHMNAQVVGPEFYLLK